MTLNGAIAELVILREHSMMPEIFKGSLDKVIETISECEEPSAQPEPQWIPCSERLPEDLEEVNVTWRNNNPEPYYDFVKGVNATGTAVYYKGEWYWYSSVTVDVLAEYGRYDSEELDEAIEVVAWMPLPEPYKGDE